MATNLEKQKATGRIQDWYLKHRLKGRGILSPTPAQIAEERLRAEGQWSGGKYFRSGIEKPLKQINAFTGEAEEVKPYVSPISLLTEKDVAEFKEKYGENGERFGEPPVWHGDWPTPEQQLGFGFDEDLNFSE
jgi:hypothetical protein